MGLIKLIEESGHTLYTEGNGFISSDDVVVQALIDNYDPLPYERIQAKAKLVEQANAAMQVIEDAYPEFEKKLFPYQKADVDAWKADSNAATPTIDALATKRGKLREEHLAATAAKVDAYHTMATNYAGERQRLEDLIDNETDWKIIQQINFVV